MADVKKIMKKAFDTKQAEREIEHLLGYMDIHLMLLNKAIEFSDAESIELQKNQLEKIRRRLIELEYFNMGEKSVNKVRIKA